MFEIMSESSGNILGVKATGKLTDDDYKNTFLPKLASIITEHKTARILMYLDENFEGWTPKAMWDDAHFGWIHRNDFDKLAVVGGQKWIEWSVKLSSHMMKAEIKTFETDKLADAWSWIRS